MVKGVANDQVAAVPIAAGLGAGLVVFLGIGRTLRSVIYGIDPWDPVTTGAALLILAATALAATWLPARRAARTSPLEILGED